MWIKEKKNITMKIIYKSYMARPLKPFGEWDWEVREAVDRKSVV